MLFFSTEPSVLLLFITLQTIVLLAYLADLGDTLIITSILAGDKKFKTISFDHKWLKPLTFEKEMPNTEFRRHRTVRPPKFDIDVNIPIKLPLEDEYPQEEYKKPVESNIFFQTGEIEEPRNHYNKQPQKYPTESVSSANDQYASASNQNQNQIGQMAPATAGQSNGINLNMKDGLRGLLPALARSIKFQPQFITESPSSPASNARSDYRENTLQASGAPSLQNYNPNQQLLSMNQMPAPQMTSGQGNSLLTFSDQISSRNYAPQRQQQQQPYQPYQPYQPPKLDSYNQDPEFIPGGFVNLQLSGPTGGPKMTYEDVDKEGWAQQLSQASGAMPYPILNYHQLQNFYGGLGTFTNGLAEHRYVQSGLLDKLKSGLDHFTNKFAHFG